MKKLFYLYFVLLFSAAGCTDNDNPVNVTEKNYKEYAALLVQSGMNAPIEVALSSELSGPVEWKYEHVGYYTATLAGEFTVNTIILCTLSNDNAGTVKGQRINENKIAISTSDNNFDLSDSILNRASILIRVYN